MTPISTPIMDPYVQYGCLGIVAVSIGWFLFKGLPTMLMAHKEAMTTLTLYREETTSCRDERSRETASNALEREKDRQFRHEQSNLFQAALGELHTSLIDLRDAINSKG